MKFHWFFVVLREHARFRVEVPPDTKTAKKTIPKLIKKARKFIKQGAKIIERASKKQKAIMENAADMKPKVINK